MLIFLPHALPVLRAAAARAWHESQQRKLFADLDAHVLKDIGAPQSLIALAAAREHDYLGRAGNLYGRVSPHRHEPRAWRTAVRVWSDRSRSRAELAGMGELDLRDLALSSGNAVYEASKPFWRA